MLISVEQSIYLFVALVVGLFVGAGTIWLILRALTIRLTEQLTASEQNVKRLTSEHDALSILRNQLTIEKQELSTEIVKLATTLDLERSQTEEKLEFQKNAEEQLSNRFKTLANEILDDKSRKFTDQNKINLDQLLEPLKVKITEFQGKIQEVYMQEGKDRSALSEQVKQLMALNNQLSEDAHNLTRALKGQVKTQGNWGELILERVLEASGLRKGHEYNVQESHDREDGTRAQPDVVIHLPEDRHLIVDAKMSLTAYEEHTNAETELERNSAIKRHLESVRSHIRELSEKNYQQLYGLRSFDFVLMFIPVEPAFMLAISHDNNLWLDSWKKNILLASPSTLLFVVRTVAHLWKQEQQNRNAQEIASRGAELYNKLASFVDDLNMLGKRLQQAQIAYDAAYSKLTKGKGNVIRQAEMLKQLGVKPAKPLSQTLTNSALDEPATSLPSISSLKDE
ncbi:MAG: DNA recombination protein RmuC [Betaproteobacteria bacterium]|nr:MAG: DNA recombination protein RmuC [Betaproteobacteria bacterium]TDI82430.1 MAG: DNA recombination protein RmuC [Betaproteobacteria bacterium]